MFEDILFWEPFFIIIVSAVSISAILQIYSFFIERSKRHSRGLAELDLYRESLESQIYRLNQRLAANPERWEDVNHLLIEESQTPSASSFLRRFYLKQSDFEIEQDLVFVLMPLHDNFDYLFHAVKETCNEAGLRCERGTETKLSGEILPYIVKKIVRSKIVVAILDGRNPNVFYELGIAQALNKRVVLMAGDLDEVPFDLSSQRILFYRSTEEIRSKLPGVLLARMASKD